MGISVIVDRIDPIWIPIASTTTMVSTPVRSSIFHRGAHFTEQGRLNNGNAIGYGVNEIIILAPFYHGACLKGSHKSVKHTIHQCLLRMLQCGRHEHGACRLSGGVPVVSTRLSRVLVIIPAGKGRHINVRSNNPGDAEGFHTGNRTVFFMHPETTACIPSTPR